MGAAYVLEIATAITYLFNYLQDKDVSAIFFFLESHGHIKILQYERVEILIYKGDGTLVKKIKAWNMQWQDKKWQKIGDN